jgi:diaminohydroxyphosphoribosylaminopyrimidine deaminase/5-amino-6-(5-phosphoribosylamino)uracil reductase
MRLALSLGARNLGRTWPNPSVGAVVVREGADGPVILAQGATQPGGRPHAERIALEKAGEAARGGTLYVSLEPCSHHGRTPPCVDAVLRAGVARVVTAIEDPDPRVSGRGHRLLQAQGVSVSTGLLRSEAERVHRGHITRVTLGRPAVTVKLARTRDGMAGSREPPRLLITGEPAGRRVHLMRAHADAILVGIGTVLADDPLLTVRLPGIEGRSPVRVIVDSRLRTPVTSRLVATACELPTWIITTPQASRDAEQALTARGVEVIRVRVSDDGRANLPEAFASLSARGVTRVFCEGGPELADALASADLIDECVLVTGEAGTGGNVPALGPALAGVLARMRRHPEERCGTDLFVTYERPSCSREL